jgi:hypothetical protein
VPWPIRVWLVLALAYAAFFSWYTSFGGPLTPDEIAFYRQELSGLGGSPEAMARWVAFMESDTGDDFAMLNALDLRDSPTPGPGIAPGDTSQDVMNKYTQPFLGRALRSAAHPVMLGTAAAQALDLWGIDGAEDWTDGGLVRYRSRRDLLEQAVAIRASGNSHIHDFKIAALEKTIAYPLDPWFQLGDPRFVLALILLIVGLAAQLALTRRAAA